MNLKYLVPILFGILTGCAPFVTQTPPPPPERVHVTYPTSLRYLVKDLHTCALQNPEIVLTVEEISSSYIPETAADIQLRFGEPLGESAGKVFSLGWDEIVLITGGVGPGTVVDKEWIQGVFTVSSPEYQVFTYGDDNDIRRLFEEAVLDGAETTPEALVVPDPKAMLEVIGENPLGVGYVPKAWMEEEVNLKELADPLAIPILAITSSAPEGALKNYLACLQALVE
jgi:hypothetical protein